MKTIDELERAFPNITWHSPVKIQWPSTETFACRVCIANLGLTRTSGHQWPTEVEAVDHIETEHFVRPLKKN